MLGGVLVVAQPQLPRGATGALMVAYTIGAVVIHLMDLAQRDSQNRKTRSIDAHDSYVAV